MIESQEGRTGVPRGPAASWYGHGGWPRVGREGLGYLEDLLLLLVRSRGMIESREGRTGVPRGPAASWYGHGGWLRVGREGLGYLEDLLASWYGHGGWSRVGREGLGYLEDLPPPGTVTGDDRESGGKDWGT